MSEKDFDASLNRGFIPSKGFPSAGKPVDVVRVTALPNGGVKTETFSVAKGVPNAPDFLEHMIATGDCPPALYGPNNPWPTHDQIARRAQYYIDEGITNPDGTMTEKGMRLAAGEQERLIGGDIQCEPLFLSQAEHGAGELAALPDYSSMTRRAAQRKWFASIRKLARRILNGLKYLRSASQPR